MPLKLKVDSLDEVQEAFRSAYVEKSEGDKKFFVLDAEIEDTSKLKGALQKERDRAAAAEKRIKAVEGIDPEEYQRLRDEEDARKAKKLKDEGDFKSIEQQLKDKHTKELAKEQGVSGKLRGKLEKTLVDAEALRALAAAGAEKSAKLLLPHVKDAVKVVETEDGDFEVRVLDAKGKPRISTKGEGYMSIAELIEEMKASEEFGVAFPGAQQSGSGAGDGKRIGNGSMVKAKSDFKTLSEKADWILKHGQEAYHALPRTRA